MFVSTFYSFKGGVGRTLALVNVAAELAKTGRNVLVVDFDLEAPGVDTFQELKGPADQKGIVDFVNDYLDLGTPPDVTNYVFRAPVSSTTAIPGQIWVMPSGKRGTDYGSRLANIHWQDLYSKHEGFLLFEDLKRQWKETLNPDYVLIDSRTGFTEVGGICTRQLPNHVVVLFIPNEQNLRGLLPLIESIELEKKQSPELSIEIQYVASNVPVLDDEEGILQQLMNRFREVLSRNRSKKDKPLRIQMIQRYESLQLLNQDLFVLQRPRSRLANEYRDVMDSLIASNLDDRQGVIDFLKKQVSPRTMSNHRVLDVENRVSSILERHATDSEVLLWVGRYFRLKGSSKVATSLFEQAYAFASKSEYVSEAELLVDLSESLILDQRKDEAIDSLNAALLHPKLSIDSLRRAIPLWQQIDASPPKEIADLKVISALDIDELEYLLGPMNTSREWQQLAFQIVDTRLQSEDWTRKEVKESGLAHLSLLSCIGAGRRDVLERTIDRLTQIEEDSLPNLFNKAVGKWCLAGNPDERSFQLVIDEVKRQSWESKDANFHQCVAMTYSIVGDKKLAEIHLLHSRQLNEKVPVNKFSCWRYLEVSSKEFADDLLAIEKFIQDGVGTPFFLEK
jgi:MinD-like ATPase involved in chromosome partitioning or flagellar assembly